MTEFSITRRAAVLGAAAGLAIPAVARANALEKARQAYEGKPGVALMDNPAEGLWPTPLDSTNGDTCYVGRMRRDMAVDNALALWVVGDQVRKGAAGDGNIVVIEQ